MRFLCYPSHRHSMKQWRHFIVSLEPRRWHPLKHYSNAGDRFLLALIKMPIKTPLNIFLCLKERGPLTRTFFTSEARNVTFNSFVPWFFILQRKRELIEASRISLAGDTYLSIPSPNKVGTCLSFIRRLYMYYVPKQGRLRWQAYDWSHN